MKGVVVMKTIKFRKKEYAIIDKETLEDVLYTAIALYDLNVVNAMHPENKLLIENVTAGDVKFVLKHCISARQIVGRILEALESP